MSLGYDFLLDSTHLIADTHTFNDDKKFYDSKTHVHEFTYYLLADHPTLLSIREEESMAEYLSPGVFNERRPASMQPVQGVSTSTAAFIGGADRGPVDKAVLITSWEQYKRVFSQGLSSAFSPNHYLAYSVFGFFNNGGSRCYVKRVVGSGALKATASNTALTVTALDEGAWANGLEVKITTDNSLYDVTLEVDGDVIEVFTGLVDNPTKTNFFETAINGRSRFITISIDDDTLLGADTLTLAAGANGSAPVVADYIDGMNLFSARRINLVAAPGGEDVAVGLNSAVKAYAESRRDCMAIIDVPQGKGPDAAVEYRDTFGGSDYAALYYPWVKVLDPLSRAQDPTKEVPPSGHVMGMIARTDTNRGFFKAPAGTEANLVGVVGLEYEVSRGEHDILNPKNVNVIRFFSNAGVVVWGARTISANPELRYLPVQRTLIHIEQSLVEGTQFAVFEPNNATLWRRLRVTVNAFLLLLYRQGAFAGESAREAFYVKCDGELNDEIAQQAGVVYIEVGVAPVRPAEFVVIRIGQKQLNE